jgi:HPt (histidine-containing phosphotransfer) domain-containing protein
MSGAVNPTFLKTSLPSVTSVYGKGSEFIATLPQRYDSAEAIASVNDREKQGVILYHERAQYAESISRTLESLGVTFRIAAEPSAFITQAHALKSASASIGASEISRDAAALEAAGKNRDMEAVESALGAFCDRLSSLAERIGMAIPAKNRDGEGSGDSGGEILLRLKDALVSEDVRAVDEILAELQCAPDTLMGESISRISDCVLVSDFRKAAWEVEVLLAASKEPVT